MKINDLIIRLKDIENNFNNPNIKGLKGVSLKFNKENKDIEFICIATDDAILFNPEMTWENKTIKEHFDPKVINKYIP